MSIAQKKQEDGGEHKKEEIVMRKHTKMIISLVMALCIFSTMPVYAKEEETATTDYYWLDSELAYNLGDAMDASSLHFVMQEAQSTRRNPILMFKEVNAKAIDSMRIKEKSIKYREGTDDKEMHCFNPQIGRNLEEKQVYSFTKDDAGRVVYNIFERIASGHDANGRQMEDFTRMLDVVPQIHYSDKDRCYYSYIAAEGLGKGYVITLYLKSDDGGKTITSVSCEILTGLYVYGVDKGGKTAAEAMERSLISYQLSMVAAIEDTIAGKAEIYERFQPYFFEGGKKKLPKKYSFDGYRSKIKYYSNSDETMLRGSTLRLLEFTLEKEK